MKDFTVTEQIMVLCVAKNGIFERTPNNLGALLTAALTDLALAECVVLDGKNVRITGDLPENIAFLQPIYSFIARRGKARIGDVIAEFATKLSGKGARALRESVFEKLSDGGAAAYKKGAFLGLGATCVPTRETADAVIAAIRTANENAAAAAVIARTTGHLKAHLSADELACAATLTGRAADTAGMFVGALLNPSRKV